MSFERIKAGQMQNKKSILEVVKRHGYFLYSRHLVGIAPSDFVLNQRGMIRYLKSLHKKSLVGVEIGVKYGNNTRYMLKTLDIQKLYAIDIILTDRGIKKLSPDMRVCLIKGDSQSDEIVDRIPCDLDFVYIDGDHTKEGVVNNLMLYYPRVKPGGVIGGHDFDADHMGVCQGVFTFAFQKDIPVYGSLKDWYMVKE